jgi:endonuclease/exonuclease/phosphatase (EEP) superfamily protein YafD
VSILKRWMAGIAIAGACPLILVIGAGYLGFVHPAGDSFAVFRAQFAVLLLALAALVWLSGIRKFAALSATFALFAGIPLLIAYQQTGTTGGLTLYQKNMLYINDDLPGLAADIIATQPDFITLQEVSDANAALMDDLLSTYPTQHFCSFSRVGGAAVLSNHTSVPGSATCARGMAAIQVETGAGPVWLISIHLHWPWPYGQAAQVNELVPSIAAFDGPKIIGGDFNMVPWSSHMRRFVQASSAQFAQPVRGTYTGFGPLMHLPIDHVLTPAGGSTTVRPLLGADHLGLLVQFDLP